MNISKVGSIIVRVALGVTIVLVLLEVIDITQFWMPIIVVTFAVGAIGLPILDWWRDLRKPEVSSRVKIIMIAKSSSWLGWKFSRGFNRSKGYYVTYDFLTEGIQKEIFVPFSKLSSNDTDLKPNNVGILTLRGSRYVRFYTAK